MKTGRELAIQRLDKYMMTVYFCIHLCDCLFRYTCARCTAVNLPADSSRMLTITRACDMAIIPSIPAHNAYVKAMLKRMELLKPKADNNKGG